jgi:hypothetical protein
MPLELALGPTHQTHQASPPADDSPHAPACAALLALEGDRITLLARHSVPPGAPLVLRSTGGELFEARVRGCRQNEGSHEFVLVLRLVNLSKQGRAFLAALMNQSKLPDSSPTKVPPGA